MNLQTIFSRKSAPARLAKKQPWRVRHEEDLILLMGFFVIAVMLFIAFAFVGQMDPWNNGVIA